MEYIELLFKPIYWAFSCFLDEAFSFDGVPFWSIYVAAIVIGIVIVNLIPIAGINTDDPREKRGRNKGGRNYDDRTVIIDQDGIYYDR